MTAISQWTISPFILEIILQVALTFFKHALSYLE
jgi:hypothetical protein